MTYLFFAYRDWAVDIFKNIKNDKDDFILISNKNSCNKKFIDKINPDKIFFYGWSWIISNDIIENYECFCLHPSKLPEYRGGSPIQNQIIDGVKNSSVTIFKMNNQVDAGAICFQEDLDLGGYLPEIFYRIEKIGIRGTLKIINNDFVLIEQDETRSSFYKRRNIKDSEIDPQDFNKYDAEYFYNKVRCLQPPYPEVFIKCQNGRIFLEKIRFENEL